MIGSKKVGSFYFIFTRTPPEKVENLACTMAANQTPKAPRKRCHFLQDIATTIDAPTMVLSSKQDYEKLWYQKADLTTFKNNVRRSIFSCGTATDGDGDSTGLERFSGKRVRRKHFAIECILLACKRGYGSEYVSMVAKECADGAREVAFIEAHQTYLRAYPNDAFKTSFSLLAGMLGLTACCDRNLRLGGQALMESSFFIAKSCSTIHKGKRTRDDALDEKDRRVIRRRLLPVC
jgi:hypothetical protein